MQHRGLHRLLQRLTCAAELQLRDLQAVDELRPRMQRLARLTERTQDTEMALCADVMEAAMAG